MEVEEMKTENRVLTPALVLLMAVTTGMSAATLYYAQPLLAEIRRSLHMSTGEAGAIVSASQIGYVAGLVLLVPLGDLVARRRLIPAMVAGAAAFLALVAGAPDPAVLLAASVVAGALSVAAQVTVAFVATLAPDADRGRIVGTVMSGLLLGILLARTVAGYLADLGGWRTPFAVASGAMLILAAVLAIRLPADTGRSPLGYGRLLASVPVLLAQEPVILLRSLFGAAAFGAFSTLWTPLAFLLSGHPYHYSAGTIGLFGLLGAVGAATASFAGRIADRGHANLMTLLTVVTLAISWGALLAGRTSLGFLVLGIVVLDFAVQGLHITNQSVIYRLRPEARSRITSAYMSLYFAGGVVGSVGASAAYAAGGWGAVCAVGGGFGVVAVLLLGASAVGWRAS